MLADLHAGEKLVQMHGYDVLERNEPCHPARNPAGTWSVHRDQPRQLVGDLQAGKEFFFADGIAYDDGEVQRQPGNIGERMRRVHSQWREDGEDLL